MLTAILIGILFLILIFGSLHLFLIITKDKREEYRNLRDPGRKLGQPTEVIKSMVDYYTEQPKTEEEYWAERLRLPDKPSDEK